MIPSADIRYGFFRELLERQTEDNENAAENLMRMDLFAKDEKRKYEARERSCDLDE